MPRRSGGQLIADALCLHGSDLVFCVPGESFLGTLEGLYARRDKIRVIACRHEAGAVNMAEAAGKLSGKPGIAFVTRGPGATHGSIGIHTAMHDSTPLILFIGQVSRDHLGMQAFQEVDFEKMFAPLAKWAVQVEDPAKLPEVVAEAYRVAMSGRRGPVVVALPEDIQTELSDAADVAPKAVANPAPSAKELEQIGKMLAGAQRPLMILGGSGWSDAARAQVQDFAARQNVPAVTVFRRRTLFDNIHANYAGDMGIGISPKLAQRVRDADVLLAIGTRLGDIATSGFTLLEHPRPKQKLIHVHSDAGELGRVYEADIAVQAAPQPFAAALAAIPSRARNDNAWLKSARADFESFIAPQPVPGPIDLATIFSTLPQQLPADAIIATGAGNYTTWHHRYYLHRRFGTFLGPTSGAMGYGVPAAIGAKAVHPDRVVISLAGDGCFMMTGQELATARQYNLPIVVIILNNGIYGTIRMHQERHYPGHTIATDLINPDFAALARAYGGHGETVTTTAEFAPALARAIASNTIAIIDVRTDPDVITPTTTLGAIRAQAGAKK